MGSVCFSDIYYIYIIGGLINLHLFIMHAYLHMLVCTCAIPDVSVASLCISKKPV